MMGHIFVLSQRMRAFMLEEMRKACVDPDVGELYVRCYLPLFSKQIPDPSVLSDRVLYDEFRRIDIVLGLLRLVRLAVCGNKKGIRAVSELNALEQLRYHEYCVCLSEDVRMLDPDHPPRWIAALYGMKGDE